MGYYVEPVAQDILSPSGEYWSPPVGEESEQEEPIAAAMAEVECDPDAKKLDAVFKLEKKDPKHRMGNFLYMLEEHFKKLAPPPRLSFFSWVDAVTVNEFKAAVKP